MGEHVALEYPFVLVSRALVLARVLREIVRHERLDGVSSRPLGGLLLAGWVPSPIDCCLGITSELPCAGQGQAWVRSEDVPALLAAIPVPDGELLQPGREDGQDEAPELAVSHIYRCTAG